jgi:predicted SnoaL-like aldol condensation-catalyzing enzyme
MSTEENKGVVLRWREELWEKRNLGVVDDLAAPDYVGHMAGSPGPVRGPEALKQFFATYLAALDTHMTTEFLIAEGDMVVARDTGWVKHTGAFQGIPPTGKEATGTSTDIYRIVDGKIVEQWFEADVTGMMFQLGIVHAPGDTER